MKAPTPPGRLAPNKPFVKKRAATCANQTPSYMASLSPAEESPPKRETPHSSHSVEFW